MKKLHVSAYLALLLFIKIDFIYRRANEIMINIKATNRIGPYYIEDETVAIDYVLWITGQPGGSVSNVFAATSSIYTLLGWMRFKLSDNYVRPFMCYSNSYTEGKYSYQTVAIEVILIIRGSSLIGGW